MIRIVLPLMLGLMTASLAAQAQQPSTQEQEKPGKPTVAPTPNPSDKAPATAPHEPTGWSGTQTNPTDKADPPSGKPPLGGIAPTPNPPPQNKTK